MATWIGIGVGYGLAAGGFRLLGGFRSAGEALRQWGEARATRLDECPSTSS
jgi:hypothetical protein